MPVFTRAAGFALCALAFAPPLAYGQRASITEFAAWHDQSIVIVRGMLDSPSIRRADRPPLPPDAPDPAAAAGDPTLRTIRVSPLTDATAYFALQVSEWLKPPESGQPHGITIVAPHWFATDGPNLHPGAEVLLFLKYDYRNDTYNSVREIYLAPLGGPEVPSRANVPSGQQVLRGVRLFLSLVSKPDAAQRQEACLAAWKDSFSDPEKQGVLDAMWETRAPEYSPALLKVSRGNDSPGIREWALYILGSIDNRQGVEELVPLLSSEPDCEVKRQLLFVFGMYRVKEAVTPIDELLAGNPPGQCTSRQADALRARAQEARDKITGKETRPGWRN